MTRGPASIEISIPDQVLVLTDAGSDRRFFPVSTALNGPGQLEGSECTPLGQHVIRARIGAGLPANSVFVGRRPTGEIYTDQLGREHPDRDWILTRILWLSGLQRGFNRLGNVDTMRRYIYIHGTPYEDQIGKPVSKGCIRMRNDDVIELFDRVRAGTTVYISD